MIQSGYAHGRPGYVIDHVSGRYSEDLEAAVDITAYGNGSRVITDVIADAMGSAVP